MALFLVSNTASVVQHDRVMRVVIVVNNIFFFSNCDSQFTFLFFSYEIRTVYFRQSSSDVLSCAIHVQK